MEWNAGIVGEKWKQREMIIILYLQDIYYAHIRIERCFA